MGSRDRRPFRRQRLLHGRVRPDLPYLLNLWPRRGAISRHLRVPRRPAGRTKRERAIPFADGLGAAKKHVWRGRRSRSERPIPCAQLRMHRAQSLILKCSQMSSKVQRTYPERRSSPDAEMDFCFCYLEIALALRHRPSVWETLLRYSQPRAPAAET